MSYERSQQATEELRKWSVEQAVEYTKHKEDYINAGAITRVADVIFKYVAEGTVVK